MDKQEVRMLIVHSSSELYGSDRSLLDFVRRRDSVMHITVALPTDGALVHELKNAGAKVVIGEICKIQRSMFTPLGMIRALYSAVQAVRFLKTARGDGEFDLVYSNTVAVLGGALFARLWGVPHVWHVREILSGSRMLTGCFRHLVAKLSTKVVCNSGQTLNWIRLDNVHEKYCVIWNGFDAADVDLNRNSARTSLGIDLNDVLFVLVGRINGWKGQKLLLKAFEAIQAYADSQSRLLIVGSAPDGQEFYEQELEALVANSCIAQRVTMIPYRSNIDAIWVAADVVVVPSTEPEPFGRVAIEAMGYSRPVIAAAHGGLIEIVVDGETGFLVTPRCVSALATAMSKMMSNSALREQMGKAGRQRQLAIFSVESYASKLIEIFKTTLVKQGRG